MASVGNGLHVLLTPKTCKCRGKTLEQLDRDGPCAVCDWGLGVCALCGAAEIELSRPCPGANPKPGEPVCSRCGGDGIDKTEVDGDGRLTGCACDRCETGRKLAERYQAEAGWD